MSGELYAARRLDEMSKRPDAAFSWRDEITAAFAAGEAVGRGKAPIPHAAYATCPGCGSRADVHHVVACVRLVSLSHVTVIARREHAAALVAGHAVVDAALKMWDRRRQINIATLRNMVDALWSPR